MKVKYKKLPTEVSRVLESTNGFKQALERMARGHDSTPRSWFYESQSPEWILKQVQSMLAPMAARSEDLKIIADWDLSKSDKFAPQGGTSPFRTPKVQEHFNEYFEHLESSPIFKSNEWIRAKHQVVKELKFNESGVPAAFEAVVKASSEADKLNTSSCYPLFMKRTNPEAQAQAISSAKSGEASHYPSTVGFRATMGKTFDDERIIFMAAFGRNLTEQQFVVPLQEYCRKTGNTFFYPWEGFDKVQSEVDRSWKNNLKCGWDYTKMDQHFNGYHGLECFDVIKHYFKKEYWAALEQNIREVFTLPVVTSEGYVEQDHGMPSGSGWTNFLETIFNLIFMRYLQIKYHLDIVSAMGIGDDQLWFLKGHWDSKAIEWLVKTVTTEMELIGLPGNPSKQEVSMDETGFLQRHFVSGWAGNYGNHVAAGVYPLIRNVTSQVYPERFHNEKEWSSEMFALRVIMIAENCCQHPAFQEYVKFIAKSNSNILEFVRMKDSQIQKVVRDSRKLSNFMPTYNQEKINASIFDFETFKLLRSML